MDEKEKQKALVEIAEAILGDLPEGGWSLDRYKEFDFGKGLCTCYVVGDSRKGPKWRSKQKEGFPRHTHTKACAICDANYPILKERLMKTAETFLSLIERIQELEKRAEKEPSDVPVVVGYPYWYFDSGKDWSSDSKHGRRAIENIIRSMGGDIIGADGGSRDAAMHELNLRAFEYIDKGPNHYNTVRRKVLAKLWAGHRESITHYAVFYSRKKAEAFIDIMESTRELIKGSYRRGKDAGSSILHSLSSGEMTINDFNRNQAELDCDEDGKEEDVEAGDD